MASINNVDNLYDAICPQRGELRESSNGDWMEIVDVECDKVTIRFHGDGCATIEAAEQNLTYLKLSIENLEDIIEAISDSEMLAANA